MSPENEMQVAIHSNRISNDSIIKLLNKMTMLGYFHHSNVRNGGVSVGATMDDHDDIDCNEQDFDSRENNMNHQQNENTIKRSQRDRDMVKYTIHDSEVLLPRISTVENRGDDIGRIAVVLT
jgi:hypothetical protein